MVEPLLIAQAATRLSTCCPRSRNRHGLVAGATGTGKTVTLQVMAEAFSRIGVPVFAADVKGDLSGISETGTANPKIDARVKQLKVADFSYSACPATFWDGVRRRRPSRPRHGFRNGPAAFQPAAQFERHASRRAHSRFQNRRRQRPAAARFQRSHRNAAARGRQREGFSNAVRKHFRRQHRRDSARPGGNFNSKAARNSLANQRSISTT